MIDDIEDLKSEIKDFKNNMNSTNGIVEKLDDVISKIDNINTVNQTSVEKLEQTQKEFDEFMSYKTGEFITKFEKVEMDFVDQRDAYEKDRRIAQQDLFTEIEAVNKDTIEKIDSISSVISSNQETIKENKDEIVSLANKIDNLYKQTNLNKVLNIIQLVGLAIVVIILLIK